jgi:chaperone required for assembly of F1-ATPase
MSGPEKPGAPTREAKTRIPGKEPLRPPLTKRFYKIASVEVVSAPRDPSLQASLTTRQDGFRILLDGKRVKTPKKRALVLPTLALAETLAAEWMSQGDRIDPATMPLTRLANTAIDAVADHMDRVAADIVAFAASDLVCYRATGPQGLVARQAASWDPVLAWAQMELGARFVLAEGVMPVAQPPEALARVAAALEGLDPFRLASLHVATTLTGSALIALACVRHRLTLEEAWAAAHVDEDWQIAQWGEDAEAAARRARRFDEFAAASRLLALLG